jgi:asparagine synthase (glutamine-hydrolysing)
MILVILKLYEQKVLKLLKLNGMFAFSIHDKAKNKVFIARDFFWCWKTIILYQDKNWFCLAKLKSLINYLPNKPSIAKEETKLILQIIYLHHTLWRYSKKLPRWHYIRFWLGLNNFCAWNRRNKACYKTETFPLMMQKSL